MSAFDPTADAVQGMQQGNPIGDPIGHSSSTRIGLEQRNLKAGFSFKDRENRRSICIHAEPSSSHICGGNNSSFGKNSLVYVFSPSTVT